jgi:FAD synthetase
VRAVSTVLAFGCFDILHYGHLQYLSKARELGDRLVVVVARDSTIRKSKGREPIFDENARLQMVRALKLVDEARLGNEFGEGQKYDIVGAIRPSGIALGYDQVENEFSLRQYLKQNGMLTVKVVRITHVEDEEVYKSSKAIDRIRNCILKEF